MPSSPEMERILARELDKLPERQRLVLSLYYHEDMNMKEIAKTLGGDGSARLPDTQPGDTQSETGNEQTPGEVGPKKRTPINRLRKLRHCSMSYISPCGGIFYILLPTSQPAAVASGIIPGLVQSPTV